MNIATRSAAGLFLILCAGAVSAQDTGAEPRIGAHGLALPATFSGMLPCADCAGITHYLDLFADQTWQMRREWRGRAEPLVRDEIGVWHADPARTAIVLTGSGEAPMFWEVKASDRIRAMDLEGRPIESDLPYDLAAGQLDETDLSLFLGGMVTYMADAAVFEHCVTGRSYPIAIDDSWIDLERAYLGAVDGGTPLYATFDGSISMRPAMEGPDRRTVTVERFVGVFPGQTCDHARAHATLQDTFWRVVTLGGGAVGPLEGRREPFVLFHADGTLNATVGCNMMRGGYDLDDDALTIGPTASTMMACPPALDEAERGLVRALEAASGYVLAADTLALMDGEGTTVATFEAVYLP